MIYCLTGELIHLDALSMTAVIDCAGVGYKVTVTGNTLSKLNDPNLGKTVRVYTYMAVREDAVELYGFYSTEELDIFKLLITVSGVGPKAGISILSTLTPEALVNAIAGEDSKSIAQAPGVGAKTAARIVLELHDKVAKSYLSGMAQNIVKKPIAGAPAKGNLSDARDALIVLGYSRQEVSSALSTVDPTKETEEIIRDALAVLMR